MNFQLIKKNTFQVIAIVAHKKHSRDVIQTNRPGENILPAIDSQGRSLFLDAVWSRGVPLGGGGGVEAQVTGVQGGHAFAGIDNP